MLYPAPLSKDHKILEQEFCSGYIDSFGKWNTGFYCPQMESTRAVYCCGTPTFKYCCTMRTDDEDDFDPNAPFFLRTPVMVGIIAGVTLVLLFITIASCFFCSCCFVYKKRRAHLTGGLYRMQCSSTASGLMYSPSSNHDSLVTTPLDADWTPQGQFGSQNGHYFLNGNPLNLPGIRNNNNLIQQQAARLARNISSSNLPPPVFYPQNHLASTTPATNTTTSCGTPSSRPSSSLSSFTTRSVSSSQNGDAPRFTLPPPAYIRNQYSTLARHYPNRPPRYPSYDARSNNIFATFGPNISNGTGQQQLGSFGFCTLPRSRPSAVATPSLVAAGGGSGGMNQITERPEPGEESQGHATTEQTRGRGVETESILNRSNIHRLASCLSSSDSMHQALNASVL